MRIRPATRFSPRYACICKGCALHAEPDAMGFAYIRSDVKPAPTKEELATIRAFLSVFHRGKSLSQTLTERDRETAKAKARRNAE